MTLTAPEPPRLLISQDDIDTDKPAWLDARLPLITGSEVAAIIGQSAHATQFSLYHAKLGEGDLLIADDKPALIRGRHLEPVAADMFVAERPGWRLSAAGLLTRGWAGATVDRVALDTETCPAIAKEIFAWGNPAADKRLWSWMVPMEIKSWATTEGWGEPPHGKIPAVVRAQALWNLHVTGADRILVVVLFVIPWRIQVYELAADDPANASDIRFLIREAAAFRQRVLDRDEPDVTAHQADTATLRALHPDLVDAEAVMTRDMADRYEAARAAKARAEKRLKQVQNEMRHRAGNASTYVARDRRTGRLVKICSRSISDIDAHEVKASRRDQLNPGRWER